MECGNGVRKCSKNDQNEEILKHRHQEIRELGFEPRIRNEI